MALIEEECSLFQKIQLFERRQKHYCFHSFISLGYLPCYQVICCNVDWIYQENTLIKTLKKKIDLSIPSCNK